MSTETMAVEIARLRAENDALKALKASKAISLKVSEKGAVSVYGLGRFPVTLYQEQWARLLANSEGIAQFLDANRGRLAVKGVAA